MAGAAGGLADFTGLKDCQQGHGGQPDEGGDDDHGVGRFCHAPEDGNAAEREADEQAVHDPSVLDDEHADDACAADDGQSGSCDDEEQGEQHFGAEAEGGDFRYAVDKLWVYAGHQEHCSAGDAWDEVCQPHEQPAEDTAEGECFASEFGFIGFCGLERCHFFAFSLLAGSGWV